MPRVNPDILTWARETAGLAPEAAARSLQLGGVRSEGADRLQAIEAGKIEPSRPLLLKMAKVYRRPLLAFYLPAPPQQGERGEDFRTLSAERQHESAPTLDALVRDVHVRQHLVRGILEDADETAPLTFVGSITLQFTVANAAKSIREALGFDLKEFRKRRTVEESFAYLRGLTEKLGVFVLLIGNLGTHHSAFSTDVFRGFALADRVAPFVVINDQDAKVAWSFTLLHELAHVWLGTTGISGSDAEKRIEQFCNDVASEVLLPEHELAKLEDIENDLAREITNFANTRHISKPLVAYRLFKSERIPRATWMTLVGEFRKTWEAEKSAKKAKAKESDGGPNYYVVRRHKVGAALVDVVRRALAEGFVTPTKAGRVLGVRANNVEALIGAQ
ncbi:ImmA/IrrE family metallo-endopeptidase [Ralstonia solanacearum]|uniref:ImmA/IrrE family metallo-endopeptidase n=2 Tax=Ralstonia solanacearum TaxID=305 RepID=UPI0001816562|nr:XRE family transcriptional regulator [Ralstonia solanacearum]MDC6178763.1 XRE family transcriptional regulator [Ralstonia solanacearum]MDC6209724.1 XRE family transcriptional regulator [Ralstonia solanacearum]MDC6238794.1 XRE family transcriptional regulator [Ralstonia solanacearum]MDD7800617.1 XRE family transcriptional regulator [Ralstonia solanacearum]TYZ48803.1 ImmA/IrrE family metallo-endopeptidase [Ralstonia solanacearum]